MQPRLGVDRGAVSGTTFSWGMKNRSITGNRLAAEENLPKKKRALLLTHYFSSARVIQNSGRGGGILPWVPS